MDVRISYIAYGDNQQLAIALDTAEDSLAFHATNKSDRRSLYMTMPAIMRLMGWERKSLGYEKLESKSLKALLGKTPKGTIFVENSAAIQAKITEAPDGFPVPKNRFTSVIPFDVFIVLLQQESRTNDRAFDLMVAGFADSFYSIAVQQITSSALSVKVRNKNIADAIAMLRQMTPDRLQQYLDESGVAALDSTESRLEVVKLLSQKKSTNPDADLIRSGFAHFLLEAKRNPPADTPERLANLREMAAYAKRN